MGILQLWNYEEDLTQQFLYCNMSPSCLDLGDSDFKKNPTLSLERKGRYADKAREKYKTAEHLWS